MNCRHCHQHLDNVFIDLGTAPPSNAYLAQDELHKTEKVYPLRAFFCDSCWLVQTEDFANADDLFDDKYAYFSAFSITWLAHCEDYVDAMIKRFALTSDSMVVEVAANDGCLLAIAKARKLNCYGIEPTCSTADAARARGIKIIEAFFTHELATQLVAQGQQADLITANNVLAHVPNINDFVSGFSKLLKPQGVVTFEFPHLYRMIKENQFDTIYHEHYSYLSLTCAKSILEANGLQLFDVEELPTHGGSLRLFACRQDYGHREKSPRLQAALQHEEQEGMQSRSFYQGFQERAEAVRDALISFLHDARNKGCKVAAYGAAAKGNTLLNFAGITPDLVHYVVDLNPQKQGKYLPGSQIPIVTEAHLKLDRPDYVLILPWNLTTEITHQLSYIASWNGRFVRAVPALEIIEMSLEKSH